MINNHNIALSQVIVAVNVHKQDDVTYVSEPGGKGNHWALIIIDLSQKVSYYGDSLAWPVPSNLSQALGSSIKLIESKLKITIQDSISNVIQLNVSKNENCTVKVYPVQTCSSVCGVVVMGMGAVLCEYWKDWDNIRRVGWLLSPTQFSDELRVVIMQWKE